MAINFNHTIVWARDSEASVTFLAEILGLSAPKRWGPFLVIATANGVNVDFMDADGEIAQQHYAFLVGRLEPALGPIARFAVGGHHVRSRPGDDDFMAVELDMQVHGGASTKKGRRPKPARIIAGNDAVAFAGNREAPAQWEDNAGAEVWKRR